MEDFSIRDSIKQGKNNWNLMQKKILKEETDQMGGSDVSATSPLSAGEKPETMKKVAQTVSQAGETEEFKNLKKNLLLGITNAKKEQVRKLALLFKKPETLSLEDFTSTIQSLKDELVAEKEKLYPVLSDTISKYNNIVDVALSHMLGSMGLAVERMKLPPVKNIDDFRNVALFFGDYDNIIKDIANNIKSIGQKNILGAKLDEAFSGKKNVQAVDDTLSSLTKIKDRIPNKFSATLRDSGLITHLRNAYLVAAKVEVLEALIKGFEQKLQRLNASAKAKDAAEAKKEAELIVLDPADFGVDPNEMTQALEEMSPVVPTMRNGPGKIAQVVEETEACALDEQVNSYSSKKEVLKESWKKVADRSTSPNKNIKPDDFTLLMG